MTRTAVLRPEVTLWYAQSLDGRIAWTSGPRLQLSEDEGTRRAHLGRATHDAVLVGVATVLADDPRLTVRACEGPQPKRIVLSSTLRLPDGAKVFDGSAELVVIGARGRADDAEAAKLRARGVRVVVCAPDAEGRVDLAGALHELAKVGIGRLLVEGGARVLTSFLRQGLADTACIEIAPRFLGQPGLAALGDLEDRAPTLEDVQVERAGGHLFVRGRVM